MYIPVDPKSETFDKPAMFDNAADRERLRNFSMRNSLPSKGNSIVSCKIPYIF